MNITSYPRTPRLINRFTLGADPEFVFMTKEGGYAFAENCGMTTSQAFGCDMAGRQAEIRAYPSRFALEVVASMVDTLRWMGYVHGPSILQYNWSAIAYNGRDGCGGHIHFGRRRPNRELEVKILDSTTRVLLNTGILNKEYFRRRVTRTEHYGGMSDMRLQTHGYEYRTLPTELASPWLAYFTMVISKLALYWGQFNSESPANEVEQLTELLELYQDRDDDAAIALKAIQQLGIPIDTGEDFKGKWGVETRLPAPKVDFNTLFFPSAIQPRESTCLELFDYLTKGVALPQRTPLPTWNPYHLPHGFHKISVQPHTLGHLPDVGMNLISKGILVNVAVGGAQFTIASSIPLPAEEIRNALSSRVSGIGFSTSIEKGIQISVPKEFKNSLTQCKYLREILGNTNLFPVCRASDYESVDWSRWDKPTVQEKKPLLGKVVAEIAAKREIKMDREEF